MSENPRIARRSFLKLTTTALAAAPALLRSSPASAESSPGRKVARADLVRIASVTTAVEGGVLPALVDAFQGEAKLKPVLWAGDDPYREASRGKADLVISHFGHRDTESFVTKGLGRWPRTVFSNQLGLFGPPADPAKIRGVTSLVQAFRQIAQARAPYVLNQTHGLKYLTDILWNAAGRPPKGAWFIDAGIAKADALELAAKRGGYVFWGLTPFLREQKAVHRPLEPLVTGDAMLQRLMVAVVVNPERVPGVNVDGATAFLRYLLLPATQARVLGIHYPGIDQAVWAPAGRHNPGSVLPG